MPRCRTRTAGFTLVEVTTALAVFALLGSVVYTAYGVLDHSSRRLEQRLETVDKQRLVLRFLADRVRHADPGGLHGTAALLEVVSRKPVSGRRGVHRYRLAHEGSTLLLSVAPLRFGGAPLAEAVAGADLFELAYRAGDDETWVEAWDAGEALPALVRVRHAFDGLAPQIFYVAPTNRGAVPGGT